MRQDLEYHGQDHVSQDHVSQDLVSQDHVSQVHALNFIGEHTYLSMEI